MGGERDIELGLPTTNTTSGYTRQHILEDIRQFSTLLGSTPTMLHKLKKANEELKSAAESAAVKEIRGRMEKDMDEAAKMARIMKEKLSRIFPRALKMKLKERKKDLKNLGKAIQEEYIEVVQSRIFTGEELNLVLPSHCHGTKHKQVIRVIDTSSIMQIFEHRVHGIGPEQASAIGEEIKERRAAAMDLGKKAVEVQKNFREMLALVKAQEKIVKALSQVDPWLPSHFACQSHLPDRYMFVDVPGS
ncbi:unnamed protein product [Triticum turgidum subsp. durum]|uniref:Syntaxin N-terminal domain-containing protein n=1 Tax=Triticum turgidum subsp. durum TaxID=4567 RepID=A0A9R1R5Q4_TRITD|nr:unnamed protein product [Triticum turgidum subsp. durum]